MKKRFRQEKDTMGFMEVPEESYYGAQTARSLIHFSIGDDRLPRPMIRALGLIKKAAADANSQLGMLDQDKAKAIVKAAEEVIEGKWDKEFPLRIWQTGSGTQSNMNANEVIANRAAEILGGKKGDRNLIHPIDHVNMSQSSNDCFPTAMHISAAEEIHCRLFPALKEMQSVLEKKAEEFAPIIKIGRTHLMDAVPLSLGQEFSGYVAQLKANMERLQFSLAGLYKLPTGGTAVGTGLNTHPKFAETISCILSQLTNLPFVSEENKFSLMAAHDTLVFASGCLRTLACAFMKLSTDMAWMGSGPRCGFNELFLPRNEPGSSIMPWKVNPTQCEAMNMVCVQVIGNDTAIGMAGSLGNFELNVYKPMIIHNFLHSTTLLSDACHNFTKFLLKDLQANEKKIKYFVDRSLMLVTALSPAIGYEKSGQIAKLAFEKDLSLKEASKLLGFLSDEEFDRLIDLKKMISPSSQ